MFGLIISAAGIPAEERAALAALADAVSIPLTCFTEASSPIDAPLPIGELLPRLCAALLTPGTPLPFAAVRACFGADPRPVNVLRRWLYLQLSLLPALRPGLAAAQVTGGQMLGSQLLVPDIDGEGRVCCLLPAGTWTDVTTGECFTDQLRMLRSLSQPLLLVRENTLLPIGVDDRRTDADDADRVTLHWYQPAGAAACTLADGTRYTARLADGRAVLTTDSAKPWHFITHMDGEETLIR